VFDHVTIRAADRTASERFYRTLLGPLGVEPTHADEDLIEWDDFSILAAEDERRVTRGLHVAFVSRSRSDVEEAWQAGIDAGYTDAGQPGERRQYRPDYYGAFLRDPAGNSIEAVHHGDTRRGGHIDHLWIGVRALAPAAAFYQAIARHTGLRPGRRTDELVQFRGAWATLSLVTDGRPPTENLHFAFPAPDRETVRDFHDAALAAGHDSAGAPGERAQYHPGYYAAFVLDPDGTSVESVFHDRR
jgi:catechol 2,3-dioxygenase-like lactoylglutathione lyase family enzyme